jgi:hypothetical protein
VLERDAEVEREEPRPVRELNQVCVMFNRSLLKESRHRIGNRATWSVEAEATEEHLVHVHELMLEDGGEHPAASLSSSKRNKHERNEGRRRRYGVALGRDRVEERILDMGEEVVAAEQHRPLPTDCLEAKPLLSVVDEREEVGHPEEHLGGVRVGGVNPGTGSGSADELLGALHLGRSRAVHPAEVTPREISGA